MKLYQWFLLIHTWLQPGDWDGPLTWKPFKRFPVRLGLATWLKPGVNETSPLEVFRTNINVALPS